MQKTKNNVIRNQNCQVVTNKIMP